MAQDSTQVDQLAFSPQGDAVPILQSIVVSLGLDVHLLHNVLIELLHINLHFEVSDVTHNGIILHWFKVPAKDDINTACGGNKDVAILTGLVHSGHLLTFHGSFQWS